MCSAVQQKTIVAAFDFDGTITTRDSLIPFLFFTAGKWRTLGKLIKLTPRFIAFLVQKISRQEIKEIILARFFAGVSIDQLKELGEAYAKSCSMQRLIRPEAKRRIAWHLRQQHRLVLVSASIDVYLIPWSKNAGFHDLICSRLEIDKSGLVTGRLLEANCWGPEKQQSLDKLLGPRENYELYVYGDSRGDKELLAFADYPFYRQLGPA